MARRVIVATTVCTALAGAWLSFGPGLVEACAGLIGRNGAVNLERTTTLAAYDNGVEHYVTSFQFEGGGAEFGALIPLPGVPSNVEKGGGWTLQRLERETESQSLRSTGEAASLGAPDKNVEVLSQTRIDALDITVLRGGGAAVGAWATEHGFRLSPDAPEVLDFYAQRSPIFLAAVFDGAAAAARGLQIGDGTPVHITIPTANPWVPLRILALGKQPADRVDADVFLLTDHEPALLPKPGAGLELTHSQPATASLLDDLRADSGMGWVPQSAWLTKLQIDSAAADLRYDLAVDTTGRGSPSPVAAGLVLPNVRGAGSDVGSIAWPAAIVFAALITIVALRRRTRAEAS